MRIYKAYSFTFLTRRVTHSYGLCRPSALSRIFFFNDTATTEIYTLSLHDALPILPLVGVERGVGHGHAEIRLAGADELQVDRKSTRLNSSHQIISYAVFCLKKKKRRPTQTGRSRAF